jgi:hypothetical protein
MGSNTNDKMQTTFKTNANQLDKSFINIIKKLFKDQKVEISLRNLDETEYLLSNEANRKHLYFSIDEYQKGHITSFTFEDFYQKFGQLIGNV